MAMCYAKCTMVTARSNELLDLGAHSKESLPPCLLDYATTEGGLGSAIYLFYCLDPRVVFLNLSVQSHKFSTIMQLSQGKIIIENLSEACHNAGESETIDIDGLLSKPEVF